MIRYLLLFYDTTTVVCTIISVKTHTWYSIPSPVLGRTSTCTSLACVPSDHDIKTVAPSAGELSAPSQTEPSIPCQSYSFNTNSNSATLFEHLTRARPREALAYSIDSSIDIKFSPSLLRPLLGAGGGGERERLNFVNLWHFSTPCCRRFSRPAWERSLRPGQYFSEKGGHRPMRHKTQAVQGHPGARGWPRGVDGGAWGPQHLSPIPSENNFMPLVSVQRVTLLVLENRPPPPPPSRVYRTAC